MATYYVSGKVGWIWYWKGERTLWWSRCWRW